MQRITPFLWFDNQVEEAAKFYTSSFKDSNIGRIARYEEAGANVSGRPAGSVLTVAFLHEGQDFVARDGGPQFKFTEAVSFSVRGESQEEMDYFWEQLSAGGRAQQSGWLKDKFGLSWQIVPSNLDELLGDPDAAKSQRVLQAPLRMVKLDIAKLRAAHAGS